MAQLCRRRKRTSDGKQTETPRIPRAPIPRLLLEIPPYRNHAGRHKPLASRRRKLWGSDAKEEDVPTSESRLLQSRGRRSRSQVARHHEGTSRAKEPSSPDSTGNGGRASNYICEHAQHNTNLSVARSHPRFTNRGSSQSASAGLESEDPDSQGLPFRRRQRPAQIHENGHKQYDATRTATVGKAHRQGMRG